MRISLKRASYDIISAFDDITTMKKHLISWSNRVSSQVLILLAERLVAEHRIYNYGSRST